MHRVGIFILMTMIGTVACSDTSEERVASVDVGTPSVDAGGPPALDAAPAADSAMPDGGEGPEVLEFPRGEDAPASATALIERPIERWAALNSGRLVVQIEGKLFLLGEDHQVDLGDSAGQLIDAVELADAVLVLGTSGLFAVTDLGLEASPLADAIDSPVDRIISSESTGWFIGADTVKRWTDGSLSTLRTELEIDWSTSMLALGQFRGASVLWVAQGNSLLAIGQSAGDGSWGFELAEEIESMTTTSDGVFILASNRLLHLTDSEEWQEWTRPPPATLIAGHPERADLWISDGLNLWQVWRGELRQRLGAPVHTGMRVGGSGDIYLRSANAISRVVSGRYVTFEGLDDGQRLPGRTEVSIRVSQSDLVDSATYAINGGESVSFESDQWNVTLEPMDVGPGSHALSVEFRYTDGSVVGSSLNFMGPPTWIADIEPIHRARCAACHGDGGSAHIMDDLTAWRTEIVAILDDVETGRMPYGGTKLPDEQVEVIRIWGNTGFLEQ